jgi:hypothetical protein
MKVSGVPPEADSVSAPRFVLLTPCMKLHEVKSEPQNRRISNIEYRMSKGGFASLSLMGKVMSAED